MNPRKWDKLTILCCFVYFASYLTRLDYAAAMAEIVRDMGISKQLASIAVTGSFFTYGAGQILSGILGDRFHPRKVIGFGLIMTSLVNLSMSVLPNITAMSVVWCFNGFFQSLIWPPMVRILVENLDRETYNASSAKISAAANVATISIYLIVPLAISLSGWRTAFLVDGTCGLLIAALWLLSTRNVQTAAVQKEHDDSKGGVRSLLLEGGLLPILIAIMIAIVLQGILRDGITTWMPSYISEVFHMGTSVSILTTIILPVFSILSLGLSSVLNKRIGNELKTALALFIAAMACSLTLYLCFGHSVIVEALMMALTTACMHGINLMLICVVPGRFAGYGKISTISGILNACTYLGSTISTYGFAVLSDTKGWKFTVGGWVLVCVAGAAFCLLALPRWLKFTNQKKA